MDEMGQITVRVQHIPVWTRRPDRAGKKAPRRFEVEDKALAFHCLAGLFFATMAVAAGDAETGLVVVGMIAAGAALSVSAGRILDSRSRRTPGRRETTTGPS